MPGGLPEITQSVGADTARYIEEYRAALAVTKELSAANKEMMRAVAEAQGAIRGAGGADDIAKVNAAIRDHLKVLGDVPRVTQEALRAQDQYNESLLRTGKLSQEGVNALENLGQTYDAHWAATTRLAKAQKDLAAEIRSTDDAVTAQVGKVQDSMVVYARSQRAVGGAISAADANVVPAALAALAAGGGGGGGFGGGGGGPGGGFGPGTAGGMFANVAAFASRWAGPAHYALMGTAEALSVIAPALAAAGAAALVGAQGGEQLYNRWQAIYATSESLGPSLNKTAGSFIGVGSALQTAQTMAAGGVYGLAGAGINILGSKGTGGVLQMGQNTLSMLDRAAASLTQQFQAGGLGSQLLGLVGGGPGFLQQFGAIGGNLGRLLLNAAPSLPGVGADYLSILQAGTKGAVDVTGFLGGGLGPVLAYEAAARLGTPLVGGLGRLIEGGGAGLARLGLGGVAGDVGLAGVGAGRLLGGLTTGDVGALGALALLLGKGATFQQPYQQQFGGLQAGINQMYPGQAFGSLISAMNQAAGVPVSGAPGPGGNQNIAGGSVNWWDALTRGNVGAMWQGSLQTMHGVLQDVGIIGRDPSKSAVAQMTLQNMAQQYVNLANAGKQVQGVWDGLAHSSVGVGQAYALMTMAGYQVGNMFDKTGKLNKQAVTELQNLYAGYAPMAMNTGQFGAMTGVQTAMGGLAKTQLAAVNATSDQLTQIISGGPAGTGALFTLLGAAGKPGDMAKALTSFTSPAGAAAWTSFASTTQPSIVSQLQSQFDWLRTAQTMGALGGGGPHAGAQGMAAYYLAQALPFAKQSPYALAQLGAFGQQYGITGAYDPSKSQAQNFATMAKDIHNMADSTAGFTRNMNTTGIKLSNIPRDAQQFITTASSGVLPAMQQAIAQQAAKTMTDFEASITGKGFGAAQLGKVSGVLSQQGAGLATQQAIVKFAAQMSGATPAQINAMMGQVKKDYSIYVRTHADTSGAAQAKAALDALKDKPVKVSVNTTGAGEVANAKALIDSLQSRTVTETVNVVVSGAAAATIAAPAAGGAFARIHAQAGGLVPGTGMGDIIPAMLEPGEAIVPRWLVPLIAPFLASHRVPGFGGTPVGSSTHFAAGGVVPWWGGADSPKTAGWDQLSGQAGRIAFTLTDEIARALKGTGAGTIAQALVAQVGKEVAFAKSVSAAAMTGQGFGTTGLLSTFDATGGSGSVAQQMQSYLKSVTSFTSDLAALRKGGLNKSLLGQLIAAGPVTGDELAQSILGQGTTAGGASSIAQVNSLWAQIGGASKGLGAQAAMAMFGGRLSPGLTSGQVTANNVTINLTASGGTTLALTNTQVKQLVQIIQAKLLEQARRNPQTGVMLAGKRA